MFFSHINMLTLLAFVTSSNTELYIKELMDELVLIDNTIFPKCLDNSDYVQIEKLVNVNTEKTSKERYPGSYETNYKDYDYLFTNIFNGNLMMEKISKIEYPNQLQQPIRLIPSLIKTNEILFKSYMAPFCKSEDITKISNIGGLPIFTACFYMREYINSAAKNSKYAKELLELNSKLIENLAKGLEYYYSSIGDRSNTLIPETKDRVLNVLEDGISTVKSISERLEKNEYESQMIYNSCRLIVFILSTTIEFIHGVQLFDVSGPSAKVFEYFGNSAMYFRAATVSLGYLVLFPSNIQSFEEAMKSADKSNRIFEQPRNSCNSETTNN